MTEAEGGDEGQSLVSTASGYVDGMQTIESERDFRKREAAYFTSKREAEGRLTAVRARIDKEMGIRG